MTNILIVFDHWNATRFDSDYWPTANWFFGPRGNLLKAIATMAVIIPTQDNRGNYDEQLMEAALDLIGYRCDDTDETYPAPDLSDDQRQEVANYLVECNKAMRPYLPDNGEISLHSYITSPEYDELYLIIKHYDNQEHTDPVSTGTGIRAVSTIG